MDEKTVKNKGNESAWSALGLAWNLGYTIAIPIVFFAFLGRYLDKKWDLSPWMLLLGIFLAMTTSGIMIYRKTMNILGDIDKEQPSEGPSGRSNTELK